MAGLLFYHRSGENPNRKKATGYSDGQKNGQRSCIRKPRRILPLYVSAKRFRLSGGGKGCPEYVR